jgi:D-glycero-D-manno-heptose 1,7-bisphosphate phosphatase
MCGFSRGYWRKICAMLRKRAVFLDRDGVINVTHFRAGKSRAPDRLEEFEYLPGVQEAVNSLKNAGFLLIVVTNQPDVARGWQKKEIVDAMNAKVFCDLAIDDLKVCFHDNDQCECRKPKPGMLIEAAAEWRIDLARSYMIGDRQSDLEAGFAAGCSSILIGKGDEEQPTRAPVAKADSLFQAAEWILKHELDLANIPAFR